MTTPPSIRRRLSRTLLGLALGWGLVVSAVVWLTVRHEVDELLDDTLQASSRVLIDVLAVSGDALASGVGASAGALLPDAAHDDERFGWQIVGPGPKVLLRSAAAPAQAWVADLAPGYADVERWRVYGVPLAGSTRVLYVAQTRRERHEALLEVSLSAVAASLLVGLLTAVWLRTRVVRELAPLTDLSQALAHFEPLRAGAELGPPQREELVAIHDAIAALGHRLARRVASERAFSAHAAHALRTPLAGIDAQLAVAWRESPPPLRPRLQRVRSAAARLSRVVAALLALFRSGADVQRQRLDLAELLARMPVDGLAVQVQAPAWLDADPDLLAAVLLNLLDNAQRHGAQRVEVRVQGRSVHLVDDGAGCTSARRAEVLAALQRQDDTGPLGLGLRLADLVARAHGGVLLLPEVDAGFAVELRLGPG